MSPEESASGRMVRVSLNYEYQAVSHQHGIFSNKTYGIQTNRQYSCLNLPTKSWYAHYPKLKPSPLPVQI